MRWRPVASRSADSTAPHGRTTQDASRAPRGARASRSYGTNFAALDDCLQYADVIDVREVGGLVFVLDNFTGSEERDEQVPRVLADTSRWWLLFGRLVMVLLRTDDAHYEAPRDLGAIRAQWNDREWMNASRGKRRHVSAGPSPRAGNRPPRH